MKKRSTAIFTTAMAAIAMLVASPAQADIDLAINGDFETGFFNDGTPNASWQQFPNGGTQTIVAPGGTGNLSNFAANLFVPVRSQTDPAVDNLIKNANLGAGTLIPGSAVTVTWDMRGSLTGAGGVIFVELFSEKDGGGTNKAEIYTGGPLTPTADWSSYSWTTSVASLAQGGAPGGLTLQLKASCGPVEGCGVDAYFDNVSITVPSVIPEPTSAALLGLTSVGMFLRRRRRS